MNEIFPRDLRGTKHPFQPPPALLKLLAALGLIAVVVAGVIGGPRIVEWIIPGCVLLVFAIAYWMRCPACGGSFTGVKNSGACIHCGSLFKNEEALSLEHRFQEVPRGWTSRLSPRQLGVLEQTPSQLRLNVKKPAGPGILIMAAGLAVTFFACGTWQVVGIRDSKTKAITLQTHRSVFGWCLGSNTVSNVVKLAFTQPSSPSASAYSHQPLVVTQSGQLPLFDSNDFDTEGFREIETRINGFIADTSRNRISIVKPSTLTSKFSAAFLLLAGLALLLKRNGILTLNSNTGRLTLSRKAGGHPVEFDLNSIVAFGLVERDPDPGDENRAVSELQSACALAMQLNNGAAVYLTSSLSNGGREEKLGQASVLAAFLRTYHHKSSQTDEPPEAGNNDSA